MTDQRAFERIAIVNRGEPAMRLIRAVREWNAERRERVRTVALFTEPDREALYVREADAVHCLGPAMFLDPADPDEQGRPRRKSRYLDYAALRQALQRTRADAAWVGWGFVAEHAAFAELCAELGVLFIGPSPEAMRRLGDKIGSKLLAESCGVPVAPWSGGPVASVEEARAKAEAIGYPLLVKATAGGGGRGIRFVEGPAQLAGALESAQAEARKAFGDGTVFLEKRVQAARHVEVQVLGDVRGKVLAVGVRDCSVQRGNQKIIEEAPSPVLTRAQETELREASVRLAKAAGYVNAGTVEYLFDPKSGRYFFMEMNTRLQVEHPVTELTTGLDLVRTQLAIARGEALPEQEPETRGHSIEVRLCAEDPERSFAPAPGKVSCFRAPLGPGVRTDSGVREGDVIPVEFDSMIAKVIAQGATREEARARLARAILESLVIIDGGTTNRAFLLRLLDHPDFLGNAIDTGWLDRLMQSGALKREAPNAPAALLAMAIQLHGRQLQDDELNFFATAARGRPALPAPRRRPIELRLAGQAYEFHVSTLEPGLFRVAVDGGSLDVRFEHDGPHEARLCYDTPAGVLRHRIVAVAAGDDHLVEVDGALTRVSRDCGGLLRAPAPGLVLSLDVEKGAEVQAGERLLSLEAMKMEMPVVAPFAGRVRELLVGTSMQVAAGDPLLVLEPLASSEEKPAAASERLKFPRGDGAAPAAGTPAAFRSALRDLRRLMLGFDLGEERLPELLARFQANFPSEPGSVTREPESVQASPAGFEAVRALLELYLDVERLFSKQYSERSSQARLSNERYGHIWLREYRAEGRGLPEPFLKTLRKSLACYGLSSLADSQRLRDAIVLLHRSHQNAGAKNRVVVALLQRLLERPAWRAAAATPDVRELLEELSDLTQESSPAVCESAQQAAYSLFEGRALEERRRAALMAVDATLGKLRAHPDSPERDRLMAEVVELPFALTRHLAPLLGPGDGATRALVLEVLMRRLYRSQGIGALESHREEERVYVTATGRVEREPAQLLASYVDLADLTPALAGLSRAAAALPGQARQALDLLVAVPTAADANADVAMLQQRLAEAPPSPRVRRICAVLLHPGPQLQHFTFVPREGRWEEEAPLRGFHPTTGERLELWRLNNFKLQRIPTPEDLFLFHARARSNERDERYFALVEVRELHPLRDGSGRLTAAPELEHALLEAFQALRGQQARRDARRRLHWNRITVYVRPPILARREEMLEIARRLYPAAQNLGIEKISVRLQWREDASQPLQDTVFAFSDRTGHRLGMNINPPHHEPLRALDDYSLKMIRARQRRFIYAYELVKMLAPQEASADMTAGEFEEYDLGAKGDQDRLVPVKRPYGENGANVVVGIIRNFTVKHPDGMERVLLIGDGTREMGALAEPECRRIIAALDLAEEKKLPLEWFPVSSGAKIAMDSGTENLDWTAAVLKRIIEFTQAGGMLNVVIDGINVGAQSYWNAEATMLMHTRGCLIMTPRGAMLLTGKRALDYSGGISAEDNLGIGGFERVMGPNGESQFHAHDLGEACRILLRYYEHTYVAPGERWPRPRRSKDPVERNVCLYPYPDETFATLGELWDDAKNPGRKKSFDVRTVMRAAIDQDCKPLERWPVLRDAEGAVVWDAHLGGHPVCVIGIESKPVPRLGYVPSDGPDTWSGGTLFPLGSKKVARAINAASGNRPVVLLANLSGFDGSPESLRKLQLEYGAEIGRAVVNFQGPLVFCVIARYHGGAYVVFSKTLNPQLHVLAVAGSYASVIGGAPAAAVVFPEEARALTIKDPRIVEIEARRKADNSPTLNQEFQDLWSQVHIEKLREIAEKFDSIHSVQRAKEVGSLDGIVQPSQMRPALIEAVVRGMGLQTAKKALAGRKQVRA